MKNKKYIEIVLILCGLSAASVGICINSQGVFYAPMAESLGVYRGSVAMYQTLYTLSLAVSSIIAPKILNDNNFKKIVSISIIVTFFSILLTAFTRSLTIIYILSIIRGIATSFFNIVILTIVVNGWFIENRGIVSSIILAVAGVVGAIFSPVFTFLINTFNWETAYIANASVVLLFCFPFLIFPISLKAEYLNYEPYGKKEDTVSKETNKEFKYASISYLAIVLFSFLITATNGITANMPGYAESIGVGSYVEASMVSAVMIANIISKLLIGYISDKYNAFKANMIMLIIFMVGIVGLIFASDKLPLIVLSFIFGFVYSVTALGVAFISREFFGDNNYKKSFPIVSFAGSVGSALSISLIGYLYDFTGTYKTVFYIFTVIGLVCISLLLLANNKEKNRQ